ncbi:hypothetical protein [Catellatospora sp. TT07R-123]|uniref:hypothetical protein n=1 Tax=Catellatospora sp. TT07R-123 TaxID=2733863 RepID=UPI001BB3D00C|nr:hypothetical protein [Catellatospora sp. TT07R-123]
MGRTSPPPHGPPALVVVVGRAALDTVLDTYQTDILSGRKPLSAWDDAVSERRRAGGDEVRGRFQDQLA